MQSGISSIPINLIDPNTGLPVGIAFNITLTSGELQANDTFTFTALCDNRHFSIAVEQKTGTGDNPANFTMPTATYTSATTFVAAIVAGLTTELTAGVDVNKWTVQVNGAGTPEFIVTSTGGAGSMIQLISGQAFANTVGMQLWAYDIPRSNIIGTEPGPYNITTQNNRIVIDSIPQNGSTTEISFSVPTGYGQNATNIANAINVAGTQGGTTYWNAFALTIPGGQQVVAIVTNSNSQYASQFYGQIAMQATYSNFATFQFAQQIGVLFPYTTPYRSFSDGGGVTAARVSLPASSGNINPAEPLSVQNSTANAAADSEYYANIVGWLVATSPGTWINGYTVNLQLQPNTVGDSVGIYELQINDQNGNTVDLVQNLSFDQTQPNFIGNVINPGTLIGGINGNDYVNWESRPSYLNNDPTNSNVAITGTYTVRQPSQSFNMPFSGAANGIPTEAAYSSNLDAAVIGNPQDSSGLYSVQNAEVYDINLLLIPGFSSGAVIGHGLQLCESRGDCLYIIDPPFGLRPQQVVDWHNGMLLSDLAQAINSSYGTLYWSWLEIFDQFSAQNIWIPPSGYAAQVFANTANVAEQWFAPAGTRRGILTTALNVEYNPSQGERDLLYGSGNAVNPIVNFPKTGITIFGQRTLQRNETALSRNNVRMLLIYLKKNLVVMLRDFVFEQNDPITWAQVLNTTNPFLADIQARQGLNSFNVICDASNNTPQRQDMNQLWVSVFLKPTRAIEFIALNLVILQTSASFNAEEILAAGGVVQTTS